jgi:nucleoid-associated protein YgaU
MGKETKIGLAVIGLLLSVFGVLLFRHLSIGNSVPRWDHEERSAAEPLVPAGSAEQPSVVMARKDEPRGGANGALWGGVARQSAAEPAGEVPAESYLPAETETPSPAPPDRYSIGRADSAAPDVEAEQTAGTNPFQNRRIEAAPDVQDGGEGGAIPVEARAPSAGRNPLRRLSAELPLETPQQENESGAELPVQGGDPYGDEQPFEIPAASDDAADQPVDAEPEPAYEPEPAPVAVPPQAGARSTAPAYDPRQPVEDATLPPVPGDSPRDLVADEWPADGAAGTGHAAQGPLPVENGMYTVQPNDTLWSISEKVYGTGGYFKAIAAHNRQNLPRSDQLTVGAQVAVPTADELEEAYPELCPKQRKSVLVRPRTLQANATAPVVGGDVYVVEEGDTLFDIARYELGKASRWAEIYELNRQQLGDDFDYLRPGTQLRMPARSRAAEAIGRGPSRTLR